MADAFETAYTEISSGGNAKERHRAIQGTKWSMVASVLSTANLSHYSGSQTTEKPTANHYDMAEDALTFLLHYIHRRENLIDELRDRLQRLTDASNRLLAATPPALRNAKRENAVAMTLSTIDARNIGEMATKLELALRSEKGMDTCEVAVDATPDCYDTFTFTDELTGSFRSSDVKDAAVQVAPIDCRAAIHKRTAPLRNRIAREAWTRCFLQWKLRKFMASDDFPTPIQHTKAVAAVLRRLERVIHSQSNLWAEVTNIARRDFPFAGDHLVLYDRWSLHRQEELHRRLCLALDHACTFHFCTLRFCKLLPVAPSRIEAAMAMAGCQSQTWLDQFPGVARVCGVLPTGSVGTMSLSMRKQNAGIKNLLERKPFMFSKLLSETIIPQRPEDEWTQNLREAKERASSGAEYGSLPKVKQPPETARVRHWEGANRNDKGATASIKPSSVTVRKPSPPHRLRQTLDHAGTNNHPTGVELPQTVAMKKADDLLAVILHSAQHETNRQRVPASVGPPAKLGSPTISQCNRAPLLCATCRSAKAQRRVPLKCSSPGCALYGLSETKQHQSVMPSQPGLWLGPPA